MNKCSEYELEISALFDGESDPATALELLEHVATCPSCSAFVQNLKAMQGALDRVYDIGQPSSAPVSAIEPKLRSRRMPRWAWGLAATIVLSLGLAYGLPATFSVDSDSALQERQMVIRLEENRGDMSQDRFMEMVSELLSADRMYQNEMSAVLEAVRAGGSSENPDYLDERLESRRNEGGTRVRAAQTQALN